MIKHAISTGGVVAYRVSHARCFLCREVDELYELVLCRDVDELYELVYLCADDPYG
jgi:hypothetical protein